MVCLSGSSMPRVIHCRRAAVAVVWMAVPLRKAQQEIAVLARATC